VDLCRENVSFFRLRPTTNLRSLSPRPYGKLESHIACRLSTTALPRRCFPVVRRKLHRPPPTQIRPYPCRRKITPHIHVPPVDMSIQGISGLEKKYRTSRAGDFDVGEQITLLKALRTEASRHQLLRGSQPPDFTPPSPQSCHAWHG
jgi:hypothetical protein